MTTTAQTHSTTTERLILRPFTAADVDDLHAYQSLPEVVRYVFRPPRDRAQCADYIARHARGTDWQEDGDTLVFAVCRRDTPGVIGQVSLTLASAYARQAETGWAFHPAYGGRGYATEAALAVRDLAFRHLGVHRVYARVDTENAASIRVCERLSMRREAHLIDNDRDGRGWASEYVYAILAREVDTAAPGSRR